MNRRLLRSLSQLRCAKSLSAVASDLLPVVAVYAWMWNSPGNGWVYLLAWVVLGIQSHRLGLLGHEGAHRLLLRNRWLNDLVSNVFLFYPLGITTEGYRSFHLAHHRHLGTSKDPELQIRKGRRYQLPGSRAKVVTRFVLDCFGLGAHEVVRMARLFRPVGALDVLGLCAFWGLVVGALWNAGRLDLLAVHGVANLTLLMALTRVRIWCEHTGIVGTHRIHAPSARGLRRLSPSHLAPPRTSPVA